MLDTLAETLLLVLFILISAFFAAAEVSFLSVSNVKLQSFLEKNLENAKSLARLRERRRRVVIALLIGNNIANVAASALATSICISAFGETGLGIAVGLMSFLLLTFGDIAPKSAATGQGDRFALAFAPIIEMFLWTVYPLVLLFEAINRLIPGVYSRPTGIERFTEEEVRSAVRLGAKHASITTQEQRFIENVLDFDARTVGDLMTERDSAVCLSSTMSVKQAYHKAIASQYSRFPVLNGRRAIGTIHIKFIARARARRPNQKLGRIVWEPIRFPMDERANRAFHRMQNAGRNIAIVEDRNGQFAGVITLEDLLEEIVGEIQ